MSTRQQIADVIGTHRISAAIDSWRCECGRWEARFNAGNDYWREHRLHVADQIITAIASGETP